MAVVILLSAMTQGGVTPATAQDAGDMVIGVTLDCADSTACGPEFSVHVSVATQDGEALGSCTVTGTVLDRNQIPGCAVNFPYQPTGTLIVTQDVSTLPASSAPLKNPISVDTSRLGMASYDVIFHNVPYIANAARPRTADVATDSEHGPATRDANNAHTTFTGVVEDDGFELDIDGVSVAAGVGVAPTGTTVDVQLSSPKLPDTLGGFAEPVGPRVDIALGDELQPASPLTITFPTEMVASWGYDPSSMSDLVPVVFASKADGSGVELAPAQLLPDGSIVVTASHLSWVQATLASISGFTNWFADQALTFLDVRSQKPICVDQLDDDDGWEVSTVPDQPIWTCITATAGELEVTFTNNSPTVWLVKSNEAAPEIATTLSINGMFHAAIAYRGIDQSTAPLVPPDGSVRFQIDDLQAPIVFDASLNPPLTVTAAFVSVLLGILPVDFADKLGRAQCFLDIVSSSVDTSAREFDDPALGDLSATIINCTLSLIKDIRAGLIGGLLAAPGALSAMGSGILRTFNGNDSFSLTLTRPDVAIDEPELSSSAPSAWPTDRDDGPGSLYIWLGANMYGFPDWIACDDARNYCLVGYPGKEHLLVQMSGLVPIGYVEDSAADPRQALRALGLPDESVTQILGLQDSAQGPAQETWTASVQVNLCDAPPGSGDAMNCQAGAGVTVDISLASGEMMGSCTTGEPQPTPWGVSISTCTVEGMPFNADFVATQDPSTIPAGYAPANDSLTLHVDDLIPGGGDQATFTFFNVRTDAGASTSSSSRSSEAVTVDEPAAPTEATESLGTADPMSLLPSIGDVPEGLVETGRRTRSLPDVTANYTDAAETTQLFTAWGWQGNAVASFALPSGQQAQSGQMNGVYVSIHQFGDANAAREALDFSLSEQAAGTDLQEVTTGPLGEYTRALYGSMDYGNETTVLVQQGSVLIRVSAAMLDGDPTADAVSVTEAILLKMTSGSTTGMPAGGGGQGTTAPAEVQDGDMVSVLVAMSIDCFDTGRCDTVLHVPITATTLDGAFLDTCTVTDYPQEPLPGCSVQVPAGSIVVLTEDVSALPAGYAPIENPIIFDTADIGQAQYDAGFRNILQGANANTGQTSSVAIEPSGNGQPGSGEATLLITFRGCPEGFDPTTDDFYASCTVPLDAPDASFIYWGVKLENDPGGMHITDLERQYNGAYVFQARPGRMDLNINYLSPVVRDAYQVIGADDDFGSDHLVYLADGETREVFVFYYFT